MAEPILLKLPLRDPREALYQRLENAPHEHAEALLGLDLFLENAAANRGQSYRLDPRTAKRLSHQGTSVGQWPTRCESLVIEKKGVRRRYDKLRAKAG